MKKTIIIAIITIISFSLQAQFKKPSIPKLGGNKTETKTEESTSSPAQTYIDGAKNTIERLDKDVASPYWHSGGFVGTFNDNVNDLEKKISTIKTKDPKYDVSLFEEKLAFYKDEAKKGVEQAAQNKVEKEKAQAEAEAQKKAAEEAQYHIPVKDNGITSTFHKEHIGQIVFSNEKISASNVVSASLKNSFNINQSIHFRAFFSQSVFNALVSKYKSNYLERNGMFYCKIYVDGQLARDNILSKQVDGVTLISEDDIKMLTTLGGTLDFKLKDIGSLEYFNALINQESNLTIGSHTIKIELYPRHQTSQEPEETILASGEFTLVIDKPFINPNDYNICMPASKKNDPTLAAKLLKIAQEDWINLYGMNGDMKQLVFRNSDWVIEKNEYTGKILNRSIKAAIAVSSDEGCKYVVFKFVQDYTGNGYSSETYTSWEPEEGSIFCGCIK
ncbi:MAG: hypothetical protein H6578_03245 [Chitinophagales bacterium]|nr:hypothetical protein [Chitinophagales bacterium]